ncbi:MAG: aspartate aminotransferase family protein [Thermoplasmatota archaeon]
MEGEAHLVRSFPPKPLTVVKAENATLWDSQGRTWLDVGGASHGVALIGHNHPDVVSAIQSQAGKLIHVAGTIPNPERARFLDLLHERLPPVLARTVMANSGAEANEVALKLAALGGRSRFVAATDAFHGRTTGALSVTHRSTFRAPFQKILPAADFVPFGDVEALGAAVTSSTAAVILEPVQGEGGVKPATAQYLKAARDVATDRGALLIFDEVQSGLDRTGTFLASEASGVTPDVVTLAKGVAGGLPAGVCSMTEEVAGRLPPGGHGSTYAGSPVIAAAGAAVLNVLSRDRLGPRAAERGAAALAEMKSWNSPAVRAVRGAGLMIGLELRIRPAPVLEALAGAQILALGGGSTGVRLLPPLTIPEPEWRTTLSALRAALDGAVA